MVFGLVFGKNMMKLPLLSAVVLGFLCSIFMKQNKNNVCKTFEDYYSDRDSNENCYYNPDYRLSTSQIISRHGYPVEIHNVTTEDGYILTLFRIPHSKNTSSKRKPQPILLQHGLALSSESFVNIGRKSLAFALADAGYDVWLGNFRGTTYSRQHLTFQDWDSRFWNFSFHEMGVHDLRSKIDLVYETTNQQVIYMGYSLGSTTSYVYSSIYPEEAKEKIKILIGLAPIAILDEWKSLTRYIMPYWYILSSFLDTFTRGVIFPREYIPPQIKHYLCYPLPYQLNLCQIGDMMAWGFDYEQSDPETLPITLYKDSDSTSIKTLDHCIQLVTSKGFRQLDHGLETNRKIYSADKPPKYNLSLIEVPVYLVRSENDLMSTKTNVEKLHQALPNHTTQHGIYTVKYKNFNHMDFLIARDVRSLLYNHLVAFLDNL